MEEDRQREPAERTDRQEKEERLVEKKTLNVILHSLHGVKGRKKRRGKERE